MYVCVKMASAGSACVPEKQPEGTVSISLSNFKFIPHASIFMSVTEFRSLIGETKSVRPKNNNHAKSVEATLQCVENRKAHIMISLCANAGDRYNHDQNCVKCGVRFMDVAAGHLYTPIEKFFWYFPIRLDESRKFADISGATLMDPTGIIHAFNSELGYIYWARG